MSDTREAKPSPSRIGPWLRAARERRDTTEAELAKHLETEQSMLAMIERGETEPGPALRAKITTWIRSGTRPGKPPPRGPYQK